LIDARSNQPPEQLECLTGPGEQTPSRHGSSGWWIDVAGLVGTATTQALLTWINQTPCMGMSHYMHMH